MHPFIWSWTLDQALQAGWNTATKKCRGNSLLPQEGWGSLPRLKARITQSVNAELSTFILPELTGTHWSSFSPIHLYTGISTYKHITYATYIYNIFIYISCKITHPIYRPLNPARPMTQAEATPMQASLRHLKRMRWVDHDCFGWRAGGICLKYLDEFRIYAVGCFRSSFCLGEYHWRGAFHSVQ